MTTPTTYTVAVLVGVLHEITVVASSPEEAQDIAEGFDSGEIEPRIINVEDGEVTRFTTDIYPTTNNQ
jgi:hypothetical protein